MAAVELRPGDTLSIKWSTVQDTPFGRQEIESSYDVSYEELLQKLEKFNRLTARKSSNEGARFSRMISLSCQALYKGKWCTGADIERDVVFDRLIERFGGLPEKEYANITEHAKEALDELLASRKILKQKQKQQIREVIEQLSA